MCPFRFLVAGAAVAVTAYLLIFGGSDNRDDPPPGAGDSGSYSSYRSSYSPPPRRDEQQYRHTFDSSQMNQAPPRSYTYLQTSVRQNQSQSHESSSQPPVPGRDEQQHQQTITSFQTDYAPVEASGASLRAKATREGELMEQCIRESDEARERGDHPCAEELSEKGQHHADEMERLHAAASAAIFRGDFVSISPWPRSLKDITLREKPGKMPW